MTDPFIFIRNIREKKKDIELPDFQYYVPFLTNRAMSLDNDSILYANELNLYPDLFPEAQYRYYMNVIRSGRKGYYGKWPKPEKDSIEVEILKRIYKVNSQTAHQMVKCLTEQQKEMIRNINEGGEAHD